MPTMITKDEFGSTSTGDKVTRFVLRNETGVTIEILSLGGIIRSIVVPDRAGRFDDIVTGFDTVAEYESNPAYFGAIVGRVANRIYGGKFNLDGAEYQLTVNSPPNQIHGGTVGFHKRLWKCTTDDRGRLLLSLTSCDGEEGFPGTVQVEVVYELRDDNSLAISYTATVSDRPTIVNMTSHSYFNLAGHTAASIYDHDVKIFADEYLPKTDDGIPTGEVASVDGTHFDLRSSTPLGKRIQLVEGAPGVKGFDHNFCLPSSSAQSQVAAVRLAASVVHPGCGRQMEIFTDQPGLQFYTANHLDALTGKGGATYEQHSSLALETQNYPDAVNHDNFPSCILRPGETYQHTCIYKFSVIS